MTPPQMRMALGKATGFKAPNGWETTPSAYPDVTNCLNAVATAEKILLVSADVEMRYISHLNDLAAGSATHRAIAVTRTEALLKSIGQYNN